MFLFDLAKVPTAVPRDNSDQVSWRRLFSRYRLEGCSVTLHRYDCVIRATIANIEHDLGKVVGTAKVKMRLRAVRRAKKRRGDIISGPFVSSGSTTVTLEESDFALEHLGSDTFRFSGLELATQCVFTPTRRMYLASSQWMNPLSKTVARGQLRIVTDD